MPMLAAAAGRSTLAAHIAPVHAATSQQSVAPGHAVLTDSHRTRAAGARPTHKQA